MKNRTSKPGIVLHAFLIVALAAGMVFLPSGTARAATLTVTKAADTNDGVCDADCSLREAIAAAASGDTISFDGNYTILLGSTLVIARNLTIDGAGHTITVSGGGSVGVFQVNGGVTAALNSLIITNGNAVNGGGILSSGMLTVTNSTVSNSHASWGGGGIYNAAGFTLTLTNTTLTGNTSSNYGGGIYNDGGLTITGSTLSSNSATYGGGVYNGNSMSITGSTLSGNSTAVANGQGGGIYNAGALTVTDCTFSGNVASEGWLNHGGGGIYNSGTGTVKGSTFTLNRGFYGGGIENSSTATLAITNTTFFGNTATDGGGIFNDGTLTLRNSTFSGNTVYWEGGSIFSAGTLNYTNTILANSILAGLPVAGSECWCSVGTNLNNLVEDGSGSTNGVNFRTGDPALATALADNGGPTATLALLAGSVAIDAGNNATCAAAPVSGKDQRGVVRPLPIGGTCDIGAYEYRADSAFPVVVFGSGSVPSFDGQALAGGPSTLLVQFNENVLGDGSEHSANSAWNYMLVRPGPNGVFDTLVTSSAICDSDHVQEGDDERIEIASITYDPVTYTATLTISSAYAPLVVGQYRLYVCGAASIWDLSANPLNGGTNSAVNFTVSPATPALPATGFAPDRVTALSAQPASQSYAGLGDLWLEIPRLGVQMNIVGVPQSGNTWDVSWLGNQAGWLQGTAFPTWNGNSVITGHVWNADNSAGPFVYLNTLWYGDRIIVHAWGQQYVYEVRGVTQVRPDSTVAAFQHKDTPWLTLTTCRSWDADKGTYRFRVLVQAALVSVK
jgi:LPXTG-site transpeptidase (sortase) family protein